MNRRFVAFGAVLGLLVGFGLFVFLRPDRPSPVRSASPAPAPATGHRSASFHPENAGPPPSDAGSGSISRPAPSPAPAPPFNPADFPIAAPLNAPGSTVARDLDILQQLFDAWRTNFPREGNPVGENAEIAAALCGDNRLGLALVPKGHPALNSRGELCDRWGTPFRFHQLSGERMEIQSAGPDRRFATADDAVWTPH